MCIFYSSRRGMFHHFTTDCTVHNIEDTPNLQYVMVGYLLSLASAPSAHNQATPCDSVPWWPDQERL